ncbi:tripartite tricarboxylate transporter substrate binding protein [Piscinibacter sp. HJYY11]|uniref:tripartite tricarboxylate transporter substrate binding protein n=1 Tax=Piscinibacter sp. HJYY11 TaxID=2801333 RepID=UPI00191F7660|nr:tripartite tricarboxylate transporter substrate-binding protein [Piscinibacter sp. HJYY11]MBL0729423.1 tripartite tricarboxylate transporter substrate binding protein [Piscinibacter sp. HJYY11]
MQLFAISLRRVFAAASVVLASAACATPSPEFECIAGAQPGGGFDRTCKLLRTAFADDPSLNRHFRIRHMPGGIGAVAWHTVTSQRRAEPNTLVAFSTGSVLNIVLGRFGKGTVNDVRWIATVGADHGAVAVRADAPYADLPSLLAHLKAKPSSVIFGGGGRLGSQDWMKSALVARAAGVPHKAMRYVAFEGGGESLTALISGHIHVYAGDASEIAPFVKSGEVRLLTVLAAARLPGVLSNVPTPRELGVSIEEWTTVRGVYAGPDVPPADVERLTRIFERISRSESFVKARDDLGMTPFNLRGEALTTYVKKDAQRLKKLASDFGLGSP